MAGLDHLARQSPVAAPHVRLSAGTLMTGRPPKAVRNDGKGACGANRPSHTEHVADSSTVEEPSRSVRVGRVTGQSSVAAEVLCRNGCAASTPAPGKPVSQFSALRREPARGEPAAAIRGVPSVGTRRAHEAALRLVSPFGCVCWRSKQVCCSSQYAMLSALARVELLFSNRAAQQT